MKPWGCECCLCGRVIRLDVPGPDEGRKELDGLGWLDTLNGWLCPSCATWAQKSPVSKDPKRQIVRVFVSGPYSSSGTVEENVKAAALATDALLTAGFQPFVPHLVGSGLDGIAPHSFSWDRWMAYCLDWLRVCDAVLRLPGESRGADLEVLNAKLLCLPVYESVEEASGRHAEK